MNPAWFGFGVLAVYAVLFLMEAWQQREGGAMWLYCGGGAVVSAAGASCVAWGILR